MTLAKKLVNLTRCFTRLADNYEEEVEVMVESMVSLLEPVMVIVLGVIVGGIVVPCLCLWFPCSTQYRANKRIK